MKNKPVISAFDGAGMGLGFTVALVCIGAVREILGAGTVFGVPCHACFLSAYFHLYPGTWRILCPGMLNCITEQVKDAMCDQWFC